MLFHYVSTALEKFEMMGSQNGNGGEHVRECESLTEFSGWCLKPKVHTLFFFSMILDLLPC